MLNTSYCIQHTPTGNSHVTSKHSCSKTGEAVV